MITIIQTTSDTRQELELLLDALVEENKVACGHVEEAISSVYNWENEVKHSDEFTLRMKTTEARRDQVVDYIAAKHSYELPEITWWEANTTTAYQKWVEEETA